MSQQCPGNLPSFYSGDNWGSEILTTFPGNTPVWPQLVFERSWESSLVSRRDSVNTYWMNIAFGK